MKRILTIFLGAVMAAACSEKVDVDNQHVSGIRLDLSASVLPTKADAAGEDAYNENKIGTIHYFIYTDGNTSSAPVKDGVISVNATTSRTVMIPLLDTDFEQLIFPDGAASAEIFVLANCDESLIENVSTKSVANLKAMTVAFADADATQSSFVMWGQGEVVNESEGSTYSATSSVSLKRVASKITFTIDVAATVSSGDDVSEGTPGGSESSEDVDPDDIWTPVLSNMIVEFYGGANNCKVDGTELESPTINTITRDSKFKAASELVENKYRMTDKPFYSYSRSWLTGSNDESYFLITLGWQKAAEDNTTITRTCYYKVVFNKASFESNCWYDLSVAISAMPSEGTVTEIRPLEFKVADWSESISSVSGSGDDNYNTQVEINGTRFLTIENTEYILNNQESIDIPVKSSHPIKIVSVTNDSGNKAVTANSTATPNNTVDANAINRSITFSHPIENDQTKTNFDYKEYKVTIVIQHSTDDTDLDTQYRQTITIIQRPALCISLESNANGQGNVYVDGLVRSGNSLNNYRSNGGGGSFQQLTKVSVSVLPEGSDYIIGDPRSRTNMVGTNPWTSTWRSSWASTDPKGFVNTPSPHVNGGTGLTLSYYYPTSTDANMVNVIAPEFIICSGYGGGGKSFPFEDAELRCSTYQEHGYPAGRWRLPTEAELLYTMRLQDKGYIDQVYSDQNYWCSTKAYSFSSREVYKGNSNTRCVYDTWYWDNTDYPKTASPYTTFTWGDAQIY